MKTSALSRKVNKADPLDLSGIFGLLGLTILIMDLLCHSGVAGEGILMFVKKNDLAEKKVPLTPAASVAKTSFAKHLNSTVKKKNTRSILIHGTPNKLTQIADMKENAPSVKGDIGSLTALRPEKRPALKDLPRI